MNDYAESVIDRLSNYDAFVHTSVPIYEIPHLYEPFENIKKTRTETTLKAAIKNGETISLKAETGSGKTWLTNYVFLNLLPDYFPIILSPILEDVESVCSSPEEFSRFILSQTHSNVQNFTEVKKEVRDRARDAIAQKVSYVEGKKIGLTGRVKGILSFIPFISSFEAELAGDLETFTQKSLKDKIYNTQRIGCIRELCETIEAYHTTPVFFIDDTDKFLQRSDLDLSPIIPNFFGRILPSIIKMEQPVIIATHNYYESSATYKEAERNSFSRVISIPEIDFDGMKTIIQKRIEAVEGTNTKLNDVFEDNALESLFLYYKKNESLREIVRLCRECIEKARNDGVDIINSPLVTASILEQH